MDYLKTFDLVGKNNLWEVLYKLKVSTKMLKWCKVSIELYSFVFVGIP